MEITSIKLKFKRRGAKRIDIKAKGYRDTLTMYTYNNIMVFPYTDLDTEQGKKDYDQLAEIGFQCYYWLTTDDKLINDCSESEWNKWIDGFKRKVGFRNQHIEDLARNSINTYKKFL